jgi:ribosome-binding protein aMBF1 (putative translation factor)
MSAPIKHQIITAEDGKPAFAVVPYAEYLELIDSARNDENFFVPHDVVSASIDGDSMIKAWRQHLGLTQQELAIKVGMSQPALAKLERLDANPRRSTLKKLAEAMDIAVEQLDV